MFAPPKKIGSRLRARYVPNKNRTPAIQKNEYMQYCEYDFST